jgi:hypothetical protein
VGAGVEEVAGEGGGEEDVVVDADKRAHVREFVRFPSLESVARRRSVLAWRNIPQCSFCV